MKSDANFRDQPRHIWIRPALPYLLALLFACNGDSHDHEHGHTSLGTAWFFGSDAKANTWTATLLDPLAHDKVLAPVTADDLAALSGPVSAGGNGMGPSWGDAILSTDEKRIFVNAQSIAKVAVFDAATRSLEAIVDVGERPVHLYNPNHGGEMWSHADGAGAFYVIDQTTLAVSSPVVAAQAGTGHGKLLYARELGTKYYATNTNDPGAFPIDGSTRKVGLIITLCAKMCLDDPTTPQDESLLPCGGTHDKAFNPVKNYAIFQCSGDTSGNFAFVDTATDTVVPNRGLVPISGSLTSSPNNEYILVIDERALADQVQIWDTRALNHDGIAFDATVTIGNRPSARGTVFWQNRSGDWEAWIPQTAGSKVAVINLATRAVELIEIGPLTEPVGASHFSRYATLGADWFITYNDQGAVFVHLETRQVAQIPVALPLTSRVVFVPTTMQM